MKKNTPVVTTTNVKKSLKKVVGKPAPAAQATATAVKAAKGAVAAAKEKAEPVQERRAGINRAKSNGMRVMEYQDHTFAVNDQPGRRLTDEELAADWRANFPESRAVKNGRITADMVRAVRHLYNSGTGGHGTAGQRHESQPYELRDGKRVVIEYTRRKAETPVIAPTATKAVGKTGAPKVAPVAEARPKGKVVVKKKAAA